MTQEKASIVPSNRAQLSKIPGHITQRGLELIDEVVESLYLTGNASEICRWEVIAHHGKILALEVSSDGRYVISGGEDGTVCLWASETMELLKVLGAHKAGVTWISYSNDGSRVVSSAWDGSVYIWDPKLRQKVYSFQAHNGAAFCARYSPDDKFLCTSGEDAEVKIWDMTSADLFKVLKGHEGGVWSVAFLDSNKLISAGEDQHIHMWDIKSGDNISSFQGHTDIIARLAVLPDGRYFLSAGDDGTMRLWDSQLGFQVRSYAEHEDEIWAMVLSHDGKRVLTGSKDGSILIWSLDGSQHSHNQIKIEEPVLSLANYSDLPIGLVGASQISIWNLEAAELTGVFPGHRGTLHAMDYSPSSKVLVTTAADCTLRVWNIYLGIEYGVYARNALGFRAPTISPDGYRLLVGYNDLIALSSVDI